jgi:hypothetical protein
MNNYIRALQNEIESSSEFDATSKFLPFITEPGEVLLKNIQSSISTAGGALKPRLIRINASLSDPSIISKCDGAGMMLLSFETGLLKPSKALLVCTIIFFYLRF